MGQRNTLNDITGVPQRITQSRSRQWAHPSAHKPRGMRERGPQRLRQASEPRGPCVGHDSDTPTVTTYTEIVRKSGP